MKTTILKAYASKAATLTATLLLATACSNELPQEPTGEGDNETSQPGTPLTLTANLPTSGKADTRLGYDDLTTNGVKVSWTQGDAFRLYTNTMGVAGGLPDNPTPVNAGLFTVGTITDGGKSATFSGKQTATTTGATYAAYYPAKKFPETLDVTYNFSPKILLTGQIQKGNGDMKHLADYNFMQATGIGDLTSPINFKPMMTLLTFDLTMPSDMTGTPIEIKVEASGQTNNKIFWERLFSAAPTSKVLTLGLKDITLESDNKLKAYMLVHPFTMDSHDLSIIVTTDVGKTYTKNLSLNRECTAGQRYTIAITYTAGGIEEETANNVFTDAVAATDGTEPALKTPGNSNSEFNPYLIATASNLQWLVKNPTEKGYYKLTTDIYVSATTWTPIGSSSLTFRGHFDGDNHSINGTLKLADGNFNSSLYFGFFGYMNGASVKNLNVNADVAAGTQEYTGSTTYISAYIGGIAGQMANSDLSNCSYNGNLTGAKITVGSSINTINLYTGGIAGYYNATTDRLCTLTGCTNTGTIIGGINTTSAGIVSTGGILGGRFGGKATLHTCLNTGDVKTNAETTSSADNSVGGIFGNDPANITIYDCCNHTGTVYGIDGNPVAGNPWTSRSGFIPTTCPDSHPKR